MSKFSKSLLPVKTFAKIAIRRAFRDPVAIFFLFLFPLIFLFIFGGIFGKDSDISFRIALINQSDSQFAKNFVEEANKQKVFKIDKESDTLDKAYEKMNRSQLDAAIVLPPDFGAVDGQTPSGKAKIIYTENNASAAQTLTSVLQEQFKAFNRQFVTIQEPFSVTSEQSNARALSRFDYTFAGMLGFSILGLGIFGPVNVFPELKKQGILRRLHTTPLKVWQYFLANVISQAVVGIASLVLMFVVAMTVFDLKLVGNVIELALFLIFGIVTVFGVGMAIGGWAKDQNQAAPLSNLVVFPMMFLSGTFFPRFLMPEILQKLSTFLPLTPVIDGVRLIATEGKHLTDLGPQLGVMLAWTIIIYWVAFKVFRWE